MRKRENRVWADDLRVVVLVGRGFTQEQIADTLGISVRSVTRHFDRLGRVTGTTNHIKWLTHYGRWVPHDSLVSSTKKPIAATSRRRRGAKCKGRFSVRAIRCVACKSVMVLPEIEVVGGRFEFMMCAGCRARLDEVRAEAASRREKNQRKMPDLAEALLRAAK